MEEILLSDIEGQDGYILLELLTFIDLKTKPMALGVAGVIYE